VTGWSELRGDEAGGAETEAIRAMSDRSAPINEATAVLAFSAAASPRT
jgi:hypothetical protein